MRVRTNYKRLFDAVSANGYDWLLDTLNTEHPGLDLYSVSTDWHSIGSGYCLKAKGGKGDLLIDWV